jgi:hypothetical protein
VSDDDLEAIAREPFEAGEVVRLSDADRALLREAAVSLFELALLDSTPDEPVPRWRLGYLAGRLDGLAERSSAELESSN